MNRKNITSKDESLESPDFFEVFYNSLFKNNRIPMLLINPETSIIVDCNESACLFYGFSYEQLLKLKITDINILNEEEVASEMQLAKTEQRNYFIFKHKLSNQKICDVEVNNTPITFDDKIVLLSSITDLTNSRLVSEKLRALNISLEKTVTERTFELEEINADLEESNAMLGEEIEEKTKAGDELRESEERYRILYETAGIGIGFYKLDGTIISFNRLAASHMGGTPSDFEGKSIYDVFPRQAADFYMDRIRQAATSENKMEFEDEVSLPSGKTWFLSTFNKICDKDNKLIGIQIISQDITSVKQLQLALSASEKKLLWSQKLAKIGYWDWNVQTNETFWSDILFEIYGISKSDGVLPFENWIDSIHSDDREMLTESITKALAGEKPYDLEYRVLRKESGEIQKVHTLGEVIWDETGNPIKLIGIAQDITDYKNIEEDLKENILRLKVALDAADAGIWEWDLLTNENVWSEELWRLYGLDSSTTKASFETWKQAIHPDDRVKVEQIVMESVRNITELSVEWRVYDKDETERWLMSRGRPVLDDNGKVIRYVGVVIDVTERKKTERKLEIAKEAAEASNVAKSQFLANMSHEIRTPMNGVMGMLQLLQMTELTEKQKELLKVSQVSSDALLKVINDILDYSKIEAGKIELEKTVFDLKEIVNDVMSLVKPSIFQKKINLEVSIDANVPNRMIGDPFRLRQILTNLLGNAVKFTNNGSVSIFVEQVTEQTENKMKFEFTINDTGIGIPKEKIKTIFNSFSQVDNSNTRIYGGTGLGLAISKSLVELMGGEIWAESVEGIGSSFHFTCFFEGVSVRNKPLEKLIEGKVEIINNRKIKLLIAEDDAVSRMFVEKLAEKKGWDIFSVENGDIAVHSMLQNRYDLILMDVQMPVMDGFKATKIIRQIEIQKSTHTPIIAMTAFALTGDKEKCMQAGMDDYLSKPIDVNEFYTVIERWTRSKLT